MYVRTYKTWTLQKPLLIVRLNLCLAPYNRILVKAALTFLRTPRAASEAPFIFPAVAGRDRQAPKDF